jgi:pimeloyl-ACP methyl ester carboxylesterase
LHVVDGSGHYVPMERPAGLTAIVRRAIADLARET